MSVCWDYSLPRNLAARCPQALLAGYMCQTICALKTKLLCCYTSQALSSHVTRIQRTIEKETRGGGDRRCFKTLAIIHNNLLVSDLWYAQTTSPTVSSDNASTVLFRQIIVTTYLSCVISEIVNIFMALAKWLRITSSITDCRSQVVGYAAYVLFWFPMVVSIASMYSWISYTESHIG